MGKNVAMKDDPKRIMARKEQAAMVRTIGERMRQARELCNLSQSAAAKRLGYANPSKLSKVEAATDTNSVPLWLIRKAAEVYEVSVDFLFGFTDDWECSARMTQEREVSAWLSNEWNKARERDLIALKQLNDRLTVLRDAIHVGVAMNREADAALERFCELHPEFAEDMRGSNRLVNAVKNAYAAAEQARHRLVKLRLDCREAAADPGQLTMFHITDKP